MVNLDKGGWNLGRISDLPRASHSFSDVNIEEFRDSSGGLAAFIAWGGHKHKTVLFAMKIELPKNTFSPFSPIKSSDVKFQSNKLIGDCFIEIWDKIDSPVKCVIYQPGEPEPQFVAYHERYDEHSASLPRQKIKG